MICPACASPLREYQQRYCCDDCGGMLIEIADFESACLDLTSEATVEVHDREPSTAERPPICPVCTQAMGTCRVRIAGKQVGGTFSTCERHGLWFGRGVLAAVFARIGRSLIGYTGGYKHGDHTRQRFQPRSSGDASEGLSITAWRHRPRKRAQTLTPINAYGDRALPCPVCTNRALVFMGDRYACEGCRGLFVETAALEALVAEMTSAPWQMPAATGAPGPRACPICGVALGVETLEGASIDRCPTHGVWFDPHELEAALQVAGSPPTGLAGWLRRLF